MMARRPLADDDALRLSPMTMTASPHRSSDTATDALPTVDVSALRWVPILANPYSGNGPNAKYVTQLAEALSDAGFDPQVVWEPATREAILEDDALANKARCVVSAGGDGSLADLVNGLDKFGHLANVAIATWPIGNENLFARQFHFKRDVGSLVQAIEQMDTMQIDLGRCGPRLFTLMASAGFDAEVVHRMARWRAGATGLRRIRSVDYAPKILRTIASYGYHKLTVEADGQTVTGSHVFVFNIPQYGGPLGIANHACPDDAMLDWIVFEKPGLLSLTDYAWTVLRSKHLGRPDVPHGKASRIRVTSDHPVPMQADGDPAGWTPIDVVIEPCVMTLVKMNAR